ncbi:probable N-acetyltransferase HLS1 [Nymphaea colorata]|nr:probable N-acetyltransferase HLS1 [Nymphaea colorata]
MAEKASIRAFDSQRDALMVEELESRCEVGPSGSSFLLSDLMGDPIARIRYCPLYTMLVADLNDELVGVVRGSIKTVVTCAHSPTHLAKVGYVLGLRVSPQHRRKGIAHQLVISLEKWFVSNGAEYVYMATEKDNLASVKLFTEKCHYSKFRTPSILVNPVSYHTKRIPSSFRIVKLSTDQAEFLYRKQMGSTEFFPADINRVLANPLSLGTWVAFPRGETWDNMGKPPQSWAVLSVWNSSELFKLRVEGASMACALYARSCGAIDRAFPCFRLPAFPDLFSPFGFYFLYGLHGQGPKSGSLIRALCKFVHNMAARKSEDCRVIVTEVGGQDELRHHIPHWKKLSCSEDLWCIKRLGGESSCCAKEGKDWTKSPPPRSLFVDPREV